MDIHINPTHATSGSTNAAPVIVKVTVQYREPDSDVWVHVSETTQTATAHLSGVLRTPHGIAVTGATGPQAQNATAGALRPPSFAARTPRPAAGPVLSSNVLDLAFQDAVMRCIDKYSPPGYLTCEVICDMAKLSSWGCAVVFTLATNKMGSKARIRDLPAAIEKVEQETDSSLRGKTTLVCDLLRAVALDEEIRGPIRDALKIAESELEAAEKRKRSLLPTHFSNTIKQQWVNDDAKVKECKAKIGPLRASLQLLPSQRAQAASLEQSPLIEL
jgi:hypothetical protein